jgi:hypothetical protein
MTDLPMDILDKAGCDGYFTVRNQRVTIEREGLGASHWETAIHIYLCHIVPANFNVEAIHSIIFINTGYLYSS